MPKTKYFFTLAVERIKSKTKCAYQDRKHLETLKKNADSKISIYNCILQLWISNSIILVLVFDDLLDIYQYQIILSIFMIFVSAVFLNKMVAFYN